MILIDTHIWLWWVNGDPQLTHIQRKVLSDHESTGIGVSAISCWEAAKLAQAGRVRFPRPMPEWMDLALGYPGLQVVELTPRIAVESTLLPGEFHRDPADQIIVATARVLDIPLVTSDAQILRYPHVKRLSPSDGGLR